MSLSGRHIVVTGGGTGVGAEVARTLAGTGAAVTIMGRSAEPLQARGLPFELCDVTDSEAVAKAFGAARKARGPVAGVVANAGAVTSKPFAEMTAEEVTDLLAVNVTGIFNCWRAALADMKAEGWGRMIAIASTAGLKGYPYVAGYCAAKHGVLGLTRALSLELARTGITVNAVCPGFVETPMLERSIAHLVETSGKSPEQAAAGLKSFNPQKRFIQTGEVAAAVLYLMSEAAGSINGHGLVISGGEV